MEVFRPKPIKIKRPPGRQPKHTLEFMVMVARKVVDEKMTYSEASKVFGVSEGSIGTWVKRYKKKHWGPAAKSKEVSDEGHRYQVETQIKELKHEIAELYLENLMLKKTLRYSVDSKKETSSVITSENLAQFQKGAKS